MHNHLRLKRARLAAGGQCADNQLSVLFDSYGFGSEMNANAKFASSLNELIHEIRIKKRKGTWATVQDRDLRFCPRRHMRKFKGNIPSSDEQNPLREFVQFQ